MTDEKYYTLRRSEQVIRYVLDLYYFQVIRRYRPESEFKVRNEE